MSDGEKKCMHKEEDVKIHYYGPEEKKKKKDHKKLFWQ